MPTDLRRSSFEPNSRLALVWMVVFWLLGGSNRVEDQVQFFPELSDLAGELNDHHPAIGSVLAGLVRDPDSLVLPNLFLEGLDDIRRSRKIRMVEGVDKVFQSFVSSLLAEATNNVCLC